MKVNLRLVQVMSEKSKTAAAHLWKPTTLQSVCMATAWKDCQSVEEMHALPKQFSCFPHLLIITSVSCRLN